MLRLSVVYSSDRVIVYETLYVLIRFVGFSGICDYMLAYIWSFLLLFAGPGAMRICSSLLRGVMATLLTQWESSREKAASSQPQQLDITQRVLELMRKVRIRDKQHSDLSMEQLMF